MKPQLTLFVRGKKFQEEEICRRLLPFAILFVIYFNKIERMALASDCASGIIEHFYFLSQTTFSLN